MRDMLKAFNKHYRLIDVVYNDLEPELKTFVNLEDIRSECEGIIWEVLRKTTQTKDKERIYDGLMEFMSDIAAINLQNSIRIKLREERSYMYF